jgi:hypothetical protein
MRRSLPALGVEGLTRVLSQPARPRHDLPSTRSHGGGIWHPAPLAEARGPEIVDARLKFNLATAVKRVDRKVRDQPACVDSHTGGNLGWQAGNVQIG